MPRRIAVIGFRASGKSTLGPLVARALGWRFVDMDEVLSASLGLSIAAWVDRFGWESFRDREARLLADLSRDDKIVVATGGGVVEREENRRVLQQSFFTAWVRCAPEILCRRLASDEKTAPSRPSLTGGDVVAEAAEVLARRSPWYEASARVVLDADTASPEELAARLVNLYTAQADFDRTVSG
ncbi:MAG: shikimate kinase [Desulfosoma sp.]